MLGRVVTITNIEDQPTFDPVGGYDPWYWAEYSHSAPTHQETKYGVILQSLNKSCQSHHQDLLLAVWAQLGIHQGYLHTLVSPKISGKY